MKWYIFVPLVPSDINKLSDNDFSIVVKKIENGKIAYGLYIYQQLIHTGYLSPWLSWTKTPIGTFIWIPQEYEKNRNLNYRRSIKHEDSPMSFAMPIYHWVYEHQWPTNGRPRSKGCLRNSGLWAMLLDQFYQKTLKEKTALNPELEFYPIWYINTNIYKKN